MSEIEMQSAVETPTVVSLPEPEIGNAIAAQESDSTCGGITESPAVEPTAVELSAELESVAEAAEPEPSPEIVPANSAWLSLREIVQRESFQKLSDHPGKMLLLEFWRTGSRLEAVKRVWHYEGEAARLAAYCFDKGLLAEAMDDMQGKSERDRVLASIAKAVRSHRTTKSQVAALELQARVLGLLADDEKETQDAASA